MADGVLGDRPFRLADINLLDIWPDELAAACDACLKIIDGEAVPFDLMDRCPNLIDFIDSNGNARPLRRILYSATKLYSGCFGLLEKPYIDLEYLDGHAAARDQSFTRYPPFCSRLHFFEPLHADSNANNLANQLKNGATEHDFEHDVVYRGYCVLKPTTSHCVGRTRLAFNQGGLDTKDDVKSDLRAIEQPGIAMLEAGAFTVAHIMCAKFTLKAADFVQQDPLTGKCASAAVWASLRQSHERFGLRDLSFADIARKAFSIGGQYAMNASLDTSIGKIRGLTADQIKRALAGSGGRPLVCVPPRESDTSLSEQCQLIKLCMHSLIDSGIAPVLALDAIDTHKIDEGHAVVGVGHGMSLDRELVADWVERYPVGSWISRLVRTDDQPNWLFNHWLASSLIPLYYINDDSEGPYRRMVVGDPDRLYDKVSDAASSCTLPDSSHVISSVREGDPLPSIGEDAYQKLTVSHPAPVSIGDHKTQVQAISELYAAVPALVCVEPTDIVVDVINEFNQSFGEYEDKFVLWRFVLVSCAEWRRSLVLRHASPAIRAYYSSTHLPRYLWVCEFSLFDSKSDLVNAFANSNQDGKPTSLGRRAVSGEVLWDATSSSEVNLTPIAMRLLSTKVDCDENSATYLTRSAIGKQGEADYVMPCLSIEELVLDGMVKIEYKQEAENNA